MSQVRNISTDKRYPWWWIPGAVLFGIGLFGVIEDIPVVNVFWYAFSWYGYLLIIDAMICRLQGHSFISHRKIEMGEMLLWSVPFWFLFEAYNFALKNWYYVFALQSDWQQGIFTWVAFATVLPACFFNAELLKAAGIFRDVKSAPIRVEKGLTQFFLYFGALCIVLPLIWPQYTFWMVWGATLGVPDYINYRNGAPSLLGDLKKGYRRRLYRLLGGGMIAGLIWEGFDYWARCKWIYTVPGLEELKIFEMPVMGFLGFPVLAVGAFSTYTLLSYYLRGGRSWEATDAEQKGKPRSRWYGLALTISMVLSVLVYLNVLDITLQSRRPVFEEYPSLSTQEILQLKESGLPTPEQFFTSVRSSGPRSVADATELTAQRVDSLQRFTSLVLHKGMGVKHAQLLHAAGISNVTDIIGNEAESLHQVLVKLATQREFEPPRLAEVHVWIRAAELAGGTKR